MLQVALFLLGEHFDIFFLFWAIPQEPVLLPAGAGYGLGPLPSTHWRRPQLLDEVPVRTLIEVTLPLVARSQAEQVLPIGADCAEEAHLEEEDGVCGVTVLPDAVDLAIARALS